MDWRASSRVPQSIPDPAAPSAAETGTALARLSVLALAAATAALLAGGCSRHASAPAPEPPQASQAAAPARPSEGSHGPTRVEMEDVVLQVMPRATLRIHRLRGTLRSTRKGETPSFDDPRSFRIDIDSGEVTLDAASLGAVLDDYVFASPQAPLSDLEIHTEGNLLVQKGKLHKKVTVPFEVKGQVDIARQGRLRLHPTAVRAAGLPVKKMLDLFDLEMSELLHLDGRRGLTAEGDDLFLDPSRMLPPPSIQGRPARVAVGNEEVRITFGDPGPAPKRGRGEPGFMQFRDGMLRFGKLTMRDVDLRLIDADPDDPFHFSLARYNDQLVAGYSKNTPDGGLRVTMPDLEDTTGPDGQRADLRPGRTHPAAPARRAAASRPYSPAG